PPSCRLAFRRSWWSLVAPTIGPRSGRGYQELHLGPRPGRRANDHPPAQILDPALHALKEAELPPSPETVLLVHEPDPVVTHADDQPLLPLLGEHDGMRGPRVLAHGLERLADRRRQLVDLVFGEP